MKGWQQFRNGLVILNKAQRYAHSPSLTPTVYHLRSLTATPLLVDPLAHSRWLLQSPPRRHRTDLCGLDGLGNMLRFDVQAVDVIEQAIVLMRCGMCNQEGDST